MDNLDTKNLKSGNSLNEEEKIKEIIMKSINIRTCMNLIATLIGVGGIILVKLLEDWALTILWIEIVVLPSIYLIGNAYIEEKIKEEYEKQLSVIDEEAKQLKEDYIGALFENQDLNNKLKNKKKWKVEKKH